MALSPCIWLFPFRTAPSRPSKACERSKQPARGELQGPCRVLCRRDPAWLSACRNRRKRKQALGAPAPPWQAPRLAFLPAHLSLVHNCSLQSRWRDLQGRQRELPSRCTGHLHTYVDRGCSGHLCPLLECMRDSLNVVSPRVARLCPSVTVCWPSVYRSRCWGPLYSTLQALVALF